MFAAPRLALFAALTALPPTAKTSASGAASSAVSFARFSKSAAIRQAIAAMIVGKRICAPKNVQPANSSAQSARSFRLPASRALRNAKTIIGANATENASVYNSEVQ